MRMTLVSLMMVAVVLLGAQTLAAPIRRTPVKPYRVIFNSDALGALLDCKGNVDNYVRYLFAPLENSHVEALFWCPGAGNTAWYDSEVLELEGARIGAVNPHLLRWIEEGHNPPEIVVREAHKRGLDVFYSFRLNDIHDSFSPSALPTFKVQHPEWVIGEGHPYGYWSALKFNIPEVQAIKFAVIEEAFQKWDFDGLEVDFMRGVPYFIPGTEPQNAHFLTEFLRKVRQHLDQRGQQRGRPIYLAVRVGENLDTCRLDGFDVETWIKEGLMDILTVGAGATDVAVQEFKQLAEGTSLLIYPCLEAYAAAGSKYRPRSEEVRRALALNYWYQGVDGIYTFNWFPHSVLRASPEEQAAHMPSHGYETSLLKEIGDPDAMRGKPLVFPAEYHLTHVVRDYPHNWRHGVLPVELTEGQVVEVPVLVGLDLSAAASEFPPTVLELRVECNNLAEDSSLAIALNGKGLLWQTRGAGVITVAVTPDEVALGQNQVALRLARHGPQAQGAVTVTAVEIHVDYE